MDSFNNIPPQPEFSTAPFPIAPPPVDDRKNAVVDLLDVVLVIVVAVVGFVVFGFLAAFVFLAAHPHQDPRDLGKLLRHNTGFNLAVEVAVYLLVVGFMSFIVWARHRTPLSQAIRWNFPGRSRATYALACGLGLAVFSDVAQIAFSRWIPKSLPITEYFQDRSSALLLATFGVLVAPLVEELLFRGFLYPALSRWTGVVPAVILTAAGFALLHGAQLAYSLVPLLLIFTVGAVLTITRAVTKSVATSVLVHMAYNFTLFLQFFIGTRGFKNL